MYIAILLQYSKTKFFGIFNLPCCQQKLKLLAYTIKTIVNSVFLIYRVGQKNLDLFEH